MKKKFKIFTTSAILVLLGFCFYFNLASSPMLSVYAATAPSSEYETKQTLGDDFFLEKERNRQTVNKKLDVFTGETFIIDVAFTNFIDCGIFNSSQYNNYMQMFYEAKDYFKTFSRGHLNVDFNFYGGTLDGFTYKEIEKLQKSAPIMQALFSVVKDQSTVLKYAGESNASCLVMSCMAMSKNSIMWPTTYVYYDSGVNPLTTMGHLIDPSIIIHETLHLLGINDLYNVSDDLWGSFIGVDFINPMGTTDILSTGYNTKTPTSAYNRQKLGWLQETSFEDNNISGIEKITKSGTYTLQNCNSQSGTLAYKFGEKNSEFFLIEQRFLGDQSFLVVQRINTIHYTNLFASNLSELHIFSFRNSNNLMYFSINDFIGASGLNLTYADGSIANYFINNIKQKNGLMEFSFSCEEVKENISVEGNSTVQQETRNYYFYVVDDYDQKLYLKHIKIFDSASGAWQDCTAIYKVYIGGQEAYALFDVNKNITKVEVCHESFGIENKEIINLNLNQQKYFVKLHKNIFQQLGDGVSQIKVFFKQAINNIFNLFNK